jgi:hypothetical protein
MCAQSGLGKPRAQEVTEHLQELNGDVEAHYLVEDPAALLANSPDSLAAFTIVIATNLPERYAAVQVHACAACIAD